YYRSNGPPHLLDYNDPSNLGRVDRRPGAAAVRGRYLPGQRAGRSEAEQDQFRGAAAAPADRADRDRRREPVATREPGAGVAANATGAVPGNQGRFAGNSRRGPYAGARRGRPARP